MPLLIVFFVFHSLVSARHIRSNEDYQQLHAEAARSGLDRKNLPILTGPNYFPPDGMRIRKDRKKFKTELHTIEEAPLVTDACVVELENDKSAMLSTTDSLLAQLDTSTNLDLSLNATTSTLDSSYFKSPSPASASKSSSPAPSFLTSEANSKPRRHSSKSCHMSTHIHTYIVHCM